MTDEPRPYQMIFCYPCLYLFGSAKPLIVKHDAEVFTCKVHGLQKIKTPTALAAQAPL